MRSNRASPCSYMVCLMIEEGLLRAGEESWGSKKTFLPSKGVGGSLLCSAFIFSTYIVKQENVLLFIHPQFHYVTFIKRHYAIHNLPCSKQNRISVGSLLKSLNYGKIKELFFYFLWWAAVTCECPFGINKVNQSINQSINQCGSV